MKSFSGLDAELGMGAYASEALPCGARARTSEEDFQVEEVVSLALMTGDPLPGYFPVYRVEKRSIDTFHMEGELSKALGSRISYGGLKDSRAVAVQYVTPTSARSSRPMTVSRPQFEAKLVGYLPGPISRGSVLGNRFAISLKECCPAVGEIIGGVMELAKSGGIPNYFGYQRFGVSGPGTHRIGRAIVMRRFEEAVELLLESPRPDDDAGTREAREEMTRGNYQRGRELLPPGQDLERLVAGRLAQDPEDKIRALRGLPVKVRRLYVQAYQSYIFNKAVSLAMDDGVDISTAQRGDNWGEVKDGAVASRVGSAGEAPPDGAGPMVQLAGYAFRDYGSRFDSLLVKAMKDEQVAPRDFYVKEMQELSAEGGFRIAHLVLAEPHFSTAGNTALLSFRLARGQYATVLLREIIKPAEPRTSGLV